jgi:hypothetical protein
MFTTHAFNVTEAKPANGRYVEVVVSGFAIALVTFVDFSLPTIAFPKRAWLLHCMKITSVS